MREWAWRSSAWVCSTEGRLSPQLGQQEAVLAALMVLVVRVVEGGGTVSAMVMTMVDDMARRGEARVGDGAISEVCDGGTDDCGGKIKDEGWRMVRQSWWLHV